MRFVNGQGSIMPNPLIAPYGSWNSPLTSDRIVSESIKLGQIALDREQVFWVESRPGEGGRNAIVQRDADRTHHTLTPAPLNVRTRVHEYGGGAYCVAEGVVYFSIFPISDCIDNARTECLNPSCRRAHVLCRWAHGPPTPPASLHS